MLVTTKVVITKNPDVHFRKYLFVLYMYRKNLNNIEHNTNSINDISVTVKKLFIIFLIFFIIESRVFNKTKLSLMYNLLLRNKKNRVLTKYILNIYFNI